MWAAAQSQPQMVRELIARGADVNALSTVAEQQRQVTGEPRTQHRQSGGFTPLLFAARRGCLECAQPGGAGQAQIDLSDPDGVTPLLLAVDNFNFDIAACCWVGRRSEPLGHLGTYAAVPCRWTSTPCRAAVVPTWRHWTRPAA